MISVLLSVYKNSKANELAECVDSILAQTVKATQIIVVFDGEVQPDVIRYVLKLQEDNPSLVTIVPLEKGVGTGLACRFGLEKATNDLIVRMDTDDICVPDRFERQLKCFEQDDQLACVGGNIAEFREEPITFEGKSILAGSPAEGNKYVLVGRRSLPETDAELKQYLKQRSPFNNQTIMYKKSVALAAGSYQDNYYCEDYSLFVRMALDGARFYNIQDDLVYMRVGKAMFGRRGGVKYYKSLKSLYKFMYKNKVITFTQYLKNISIRLIVHVLMTDKMRARFYADKLHPLNPSAKTAKRKKADVTV